MKKYTALLLSLILCLLILAGCQGETSAPGDLPGTGELSASDSLTPSPEPSSGSDESASSPTTPLPDSPSVSPDIPSEITYTTVEKTAADFEKLSPLFCGAGVYTGKMQGLVNTYAERVTNGTARIQLIGTSVLMQKEAYTALGTVNQVLNDAYPECNIFLAAGYSEDGSGTRCSGKDESTDEDCLFDHSTGYGMDLWYALKKEDGQLVSCQFNDGMAAGYTSVLFPAMIGNGFIQSHRLSSGGVTERLRHFRYVGVPHAAYIQENNLTVESYLAIVRLHDRNNPLVVLSGGAQYTVWFCRADGENASILVPEGRDCSIVSDGAEGYVVSVRWKDAPVLPDPVTPTPTPPPTQTPTPGSSPSPSLPSEDGSPAIYVDAGHGFLSLSGVMDYGAGENTVYGTLSEELTGKRLYEADLNLAIARKVQNLLEEKGFTVLMSRTDYAFESLPISDRAKRAKAAGADLLVSIHGNSAENPNANGARVYYNADTSFSKTAESKLLATAMAEEIDRLCPSSTATSTVDGSNLAMLNGTGNIPSVLVETCFLTNEADARNALSEEWQDRMAEAIADTISATAKGICTKD